MMQYLKKSRGMRKLMGNKLALFALAVIFVYLITAGSIMLGAITIEDTQTRVAANTVPPLFMSQKGEKRYKDAEYYQRLITRAHKLADAEERDHALADIKFGERKLVTISQDALEEFLSKFETLMRSMDEIEDLDAEGSAKPILDEVEAHLATAFETPGGLAGLKYWLQVSLGTDRQGRSIFMRATYSVRVAILVGLITAIISVALGALLGAAAGYFGGVVDNLVIWLYSTFSSIPNLVLLTVLAFMFTGGPFEGTLIPLYVSFCCTFWIGPCRVIRGETLKLKELEYVQAATTIGFRRLYILVKHIIPNTAHLMFINFSLLFIGAIKSEVILTFLGLGVKDGSSWGIMIGDSRQEVVNGHFWQIGTATALMFGLVMAFNILSDALQDAFDPKHV